MNQPLRLIVAGLAGAIACANSASSAADSAPPIRFYDQRCPFAATFPAGAAPVRSARRDAEIATLAEPGYRISISCIDSLRTSDGLLEGAALKTHLEQLATLLGLDHPTITVPAPPAKTCGLVEAMKGRTVTRTKFCYGPTGYLIVETSSNGATLAEVAVMSALSSVSVRNQNSREPPF